MGYNEATDYEGAYKADRKVNGGTVLGLASIALARGLYTSKTAANTAPKATLIAVLRESDREARESIAHAAERNAVARKEGEARSEDIRRKSLLAVKDRQAKDAAVKAAREAQEAEREARKGLLTLANMMHNARPFANHARTLGEHRAAQARRKRRNQGRTPIVIPAWVAPINLFHPSHGAT